MAADAGAARLGIAAAGTVDPEAAAIYDRWIAAGHHASMTYLERYADIRLSPQLLLPGTRTLLVCAFPYYTDEPLRLPIALYARGRDYHEVVRERLLQLSQAVTSRWGGETRACVDTAPLRERYWAVRSGLGFTGINNQLIVPGIGSYVFIGTLLWTVGVTPDNPCSNRCMQCMRCVSACPAGAINPDGSAIRAERCLSYLTIEHRGDLPPDTDLCGHLYGCDECQRVCPHNTTVTPTPIADFHSGEDLRNLDTDALATLTPEKFNAIFRHSAVRRTKLTVLRRNHHAILGNQPRDTDFFGSQRKKE